MKFVFIHLHVTTLVTHKCWIIPLMMDCISISLLGPWAKVCVFWPSLWTLVELECVRYVGTLLLLNMSILRGECLLIIQLLWTLQQLQWTNNSDYSLCYTHEFDDQMHLIMFFILDLSQPTLAKFRYFHYNRKMTKSQSKCRDDWVIKMNESHMKVRNVCASVCVGV